MKITANNKSDEKFIVDLICTNETRIIVNCTLGNWGNWTECDKTCGVGTHHRMANITVPKSGFGNECPPNFQTRQCVLEECPHPHTRNATCSLE